MAEPKPKVIFLDMSKFNLIMEEAYRKISSASEQEEFKNSEILKSILQKHLDVYAKSKAYCNYKYHEAILTSFKNMVESLLTLTHFNYTLDEFEMEVNKRVYFSESTGVLVFLYCQCISDDEIEQELKKLGNVLDEYKVIEANSIRHFYEILKE